MPETLVEFLATEVMGWILDSENWKHPQWQILSSHSERGSKGRRVKSYKSWRPDKDLNQAFKLLEYASFQMCLMPKIEILPWQEVSGFLKKSIKYGYKVQIGKHYTSGGYDLALTICIVVQRAWINTRMGL